MSIYHIKAKQKWEPFYIDGVLYSLSHLNAHKVIYHGRKESFSFVVTYGLHCFTKDGQEHSVGTKYCDGYETRAINLERYQASKHLRQHIDRLDENVPLYETIKEKYFFIKCEKATCGNQESLKVCLCLFKENRLLRIHVVTAFFERESRSLPKRKYSIFKLAMDVKKKSKSAVVPKEATRK